MSARFHCACFVLLAVAVAAGASASGPMYKWKDASGGLHFTDTPPPAGAILIDGPSPRSDAIETDSPALPIRCRSDISRAECEQARQSLQGDLDSLANDIDDLPAGEPVTPEDLEARRSAMLRKECAYQRHALAILKQREQGKSSEILSDGEKAGIPASIAETEQYLAQNCGG